MEKAMGQPIKSKTRKNTTNIKNKVKGDNATSLHPFY